MEPDKAAAKESAGYPNERDKKNPGSEQIGNNERLVQEDYLDVIRRRQENWKCKLDD